MKLVGFLGWISAVTLAVACSSSGADGDDGDDGSNPSGGGATPQEVQSCKDSCDQLKFFDCNDAQAQADCYDDCKHASSEQIDLFTGCVTNDTCDPECSTFLEPQNSSNNSSASSNASDSSNSSNSSNSTCASDGCNNGDTACNEACESLQFFSCIDAAAFDDCSALCKTASDDDKDSFASCVDSATAGQCAGVDCYYTFNPNADQGPTPQQIADCKMTCEQLGFFDCLTGAEAAQCAAGCEAATKDMIEGFLICAADPTDCTSAQDCFE